MLFFERLELDAATRVDANKGDTEKSLPWRCTVLVDCTHVKSCFCGGGGRVRVETSYYTVHRSYA